MRCCEPGNPCRMAFCSFRRSTVRARSSVEDLPYAEASSSSACARALILEMSSAIRTFSLSRCSSNLRRSRSTASKRSDTSSSSSLARIFALFVAVSLPSFCAIWASSSARWASAELSLPPVSISCLFLSIFAWMEAARLWYAVCSDLTAAPPFFAYSSRMLARRSSISAFDRPAAAPSLRAWVSSRSIFALSERYFSPAFSHACVACIWSARSRPSSAAAFSAYATPSSAAASAPRDASRSFSCCWAAALIAPRPFPNAAPPSVDPNPRPESNCFSTAAISSFTCLSLSWVVWARPRPSMLSQPFFAASATAFQALSSDPRFRAISPERPISASA